MQNNKRYWLRGAIVGISYFLIVLLYVNLFTSDNDSRPWVLFFANFPGVLVSELFNLFIPINGWIEHYHNWIYYHVLEYLYIGLMDTTFFIFFGFLYGKIKNRNRV